MRAVLTERQRIPTSGARAVEAFTVADLDLLAIPQVARDMPGAPPGMNGGDSDTELLLLRSAGGRFEPWSTLPAPGGEDAEFFTIGARSFLAHFAKYRRYPPSCHVEGVRHACARHRGDRFHRFRRRS